MALVGKQVAFVRHYVATRDATLAAIKAGYAEKSARIAGWRMLRQETVIAAIEEANARVLEFAEMNQADVALLWKDAATADRNDLIEARRHACRFCYGRNHDFHETAAEFRARRTQWSEYVATCVNKGLPYKPFDERGGVGYSRLRDANPECPECEGIGDLTVILKDTRKLPRGAKAIYEGVKITKDGIEIKIMDRATAVGNLAKSLGMIVDKVDARVLHADLKDVPPIPDDPIEAAKVYARLAQS